MKKLYLSCIILLSLVGSSLQAKITNSCCLVDCIPKDSCDYEITSRSYLAVRPQFQSASPEMVSAFRSERAHAREDGFGGALQAVFFGGKSTNSEDLARYFFFNRKTVLTVDERATCVFPPDPDVPACQPRDLLAQHFNIFTVDGQNTGSDNGFRSQIAIDPEQSVVGAGFQWRQTFCQNEEKGRGWYTSISFPIMRVKNKLNFIENVISDGGGPAFVNPANSSTITDDFVAANMTEAFNQPEWRFGKIDTNCCSQTKTRVADIEAKLGYEWLEHEPCHLETYVGIKIPTGNKPTAEYVFEPIVGNGRHWGLMWGNAIGVQVWSDESKDRDLRLEYNAHTQYLFRNTQCRSVDLVCKPWSRYIELYKDIDQAITAGNFSNTNLAANFATPGINILTMPLNVKPGWSHNTNAAAVFKTGKMQLEGGYNFYCRQSECVKLPCPWVEGPAIKNRMGNGYTNPIRDITGNFRIELGMDPEDADLRLTRSDYKLNYIKEEDLDLISASAPCAISHTLYATIGWNFDEKNYPFFINGGGSYEFSNSNNAVMERWLVWVKGGISY